MKKDLLNIIEQSLIDEVKKTIINESKNEKKEFYHIMCEGEPIDTFESKEVAMKHLCLNHIQHHIAPHKIP